jgi:hypothetical protein
MSRGAADLKLVSPSAMSLKITHSTADDGN